MMAVAICLAVSTATWLVVSSRPAPAQLGSSGPRKTLLFTLGQGASGVEHWDGSISVEGGSLLELEGYHFLKGDSITGNSSWKCTNRQDAVAPYADIHYTELRPGAIPAVLYHPAGIYATMQGAGAERVSVETLQGNFEFRLDEVALQPKAFLSGRALVQLVPSTWKLSAGQTEDDEPAIAALADGGFAVAWIAYWDGADRVLLRTGKKDEWAPPEEIFFDARWRPAATATCGHSGPHGPEINGNCGAGGKARGNGRSLRRCPQTDRRPSFGPRLLRRGASS
jgi:hypothetical protein